MSKYEELKRLAEASRVANHDERGPDEAFQEALRPEVVLALIAENERLSAELDCPFRLARHSKRLVEQLRAENAGLRTGYQAYERVNAELKAEVEGLRKDAARYQWLSDQAELESHGGSDYCLPTVHAWDYKPGPQLNEKFESLGDAIDAAMVQGERS